MEDHYFKKDMLIHFRDDKLPYTIKAVNDRFAICTRPLDPKEDAHLIEESNLEPVEVKDNVVYTIVDFKNGLRGPNNYVFNLYDYTDQRDIEESLKDLNEGKYEISIRHRVPLIINRIKTFRQSNK